MTYNCVIIILTVLLAPFASVRFANAVYRERSIKIFSTTSILGFAKKVKGKRIKEFLVMFAQFCDCFWCVSYISAFLVMVFSIIEPLRYFVIFFGMSEITILIGDRLHE
jgi:hypothetical protein